MPIHLLGQQKNLYVVSVIGEDQVGLVSEVTQLLFKKGLNIIDIEQTVIHSQFTMVLLLQPILRRFQPNSLRRSLHQLAKKRSMNITMTPLHEFRGLRLAETKKSYVLTILGADRPGVVMAFSSILARHQCNIERIKMIQPAAGRQAGCGCAGDRAVFEMSLSIRCDDE